ncbi:unnamed protein product [Ectocarpus sp. 12 AP-2014]
MQPPDLLPTLLKHGCPVPNHHPARLRGSDKLVLPPNALDAENEVLKTAPGNARRVGLACVVPKSSKESNEVVVFPLVPGTFAKRAHEKDALHTSVHSEMKNMEQTPDAERENNWTFAALHIAGWLRRGRGWGLRLTGVVGHIVPTIRGCVVHVQ